MNQREFYVYFKGQLWDVVFDSIRLTARQVKARLVSEGYPEGIRVTV